MTRSARPRLPRSETTKGGLLIVMKAGDSLHPLHPFQRIIHPAFGKEARHDSFRAITIHPRTEEPDPGRHRGAHRTEAFLRETAGARAEDRKSTRLNSSHSQISYAVFCLKKKKNKP